MVDTYKIYIQNQSADTQTFWCFLAPPQELANNPDVYANSSAYLAVTPNYPGTNEFVIPVQYQVGAGANNQAVGLNVQVISDVTADANLLDIWDANYANTPPPMGPTLNRTATTSPANSLSIVSNNFNKVANENDHWFSNQSFGIETEAGFIGMSWSPDPGQTQVITPLLTFYVATGSYSANALASFDTFSNTAAQISVPTDFALECCTVTYTATGTWEVTPGAPTASIDSLRSQSHQELVAMAYLEGGSIVQDTLQSVSWNTLTDAADGDGNTYLTGTITVTTAVAASFAFFMLAGIQFKIGNSSGGGTQFSFSYSGSQAAGNIMKLFTAGAKLIFNNVPN